jgi:hypothetical protein
VQPRRSLRHVNHPHAGITFSIHADFFAWRYIKKACSNNANDHIKYIQFKTDGSGQQRGYDAKTAKHTAENLFFISLCGAITAQNREQTPYSVSSGR